MNVHSCGRAVRLITLCSVASLVPACERIEDSRPEPPADRVSAGTPWQPSPQPPDIATQRRDTSWWAAPSVDSVLRLDTLLRRPADRPFRPQPADSFATTEVWDDLRRLSLRRPVADSAGIDRADAAARPDSAGGSRTADELADIELPLGGEAEGPSVLYTQILLDRARFSPGVIDGRWGANTARAVLWFQKTMGLPPSSVVDSATLDALYAAAGRPAALLVERRLTPADVEGPFVDIPADVHDQDSLDCLCYESVEEKLAELAHVTPEVLRELNPDVPLENVAAGDRLTFPAVEQDASPEGRGPGSVAAAAPDTGAAGADSAATDSGIARIVISDRGGYLHALDADGNIVFHFPVTLGSAYDPSPDGTFSVRSVTEDPWFHYQPALLSGVDDSEAETHLPPGPNNPVGVVWMQLSIEHYGIHGTPAPEQIGYTSSSGCIRLTNWDARRLSRRVAPGVEVQFVDVADPADSTVPADSAGSS